MLHCLRPGPGGRPPYPKFMWFSIVINRCQDRASSISCQKNKASRVEVNMYKHKSGDRKRKEREDREKAKSKLPKIDSFFRPRPPVEGERPDTEESDPGPALPDSGTVPEPEHSQSHRLQLSR